MSRVRERRERLKTAFSQHHLARLADISQTRVSLVERDLVEPTPDEHKRIARALGCSEGELWPEVQEVVTS